MELGERDGPISIRASDADRRIESGERNAHVRRMCRDAVLAGSEDGMDSVHTVDRRTTGSRRTLVARRRRIVEVVAAGALQEVAAHTGRVAELRRSAGQDRTREQRITLLDPDVVRDLRVGRQRPEAEPTVLALLDRAKREMRDVDQPARAGDVLLHEVDEVGAAGDELRRFVRGAHANRVRDIGGAGVFEAIHCCEPPVFSCIACSMAATMFG